MCIRDSYMSAFLGGRSGNRGACAGPCRLPFSAGEPGACHLSLKDMSHIDHLPVSYTHLAEQLLRSAASRRKAGRMRFSVLSQSKKARLKGSL